MWYKNCLAFSCVFMSFQYNWCLHSKQARSSDGSPLSVALCASWPMLVSPFYSKSSSFPQIYLGCIKITVPVPFRTFNNPSWLYGVLFVCFSPHVLSLLIMGIHFPSISPYWLLSSPKDTCIQTCRLCSKLLIFKASNFIPYCVMSVFWSLCLSVHVFVGFESLGWGLGWSWA